MLLRLAIFTVIITPVQLDWLMRYGERGIAIDDTFDLTRYNLKVAALMVADGRDRGLPAGGYFDALNFFVDFVGVYCDLFKDS